jgi:hypothetical protein
MLATPPEPGYATLPERNAALLAALDGLIAGERDAIANMANSSALLATMLPELNFVGFYRWCGPWPGGELVVGPFQGKPACIRIALGRGVCGTAAARGQTLLVPDVHAFAGHIACDAANDDAVKRLRERKRKSNKPFAASRAMSEQCCGSFSYTPAGPSSRMENKHPPALTTASTLLGNSWLRHQFGSATHCRCSGGTDSDSTLPESSSSRRRAQTS